MNRLLLLAVLFLPAAAAAQEKVTPQGDPAVSKAIDGHIDAALKADKLSVAALAGDAAFLRRVSLDLLGRIPTPAEVKAYLEDKGPNKHHVLIDRLLVHPEMALYWREVINVWLNGRPIEAGPGYDEFRRYLQRSLEENKPWDRVARELLAPGSDEATQPASYFLASRLRLPKEDQLDGMTVAVAASFFGVRLECAKCHDHPYVDAWKQDHYYGLASFLNRLQVANVKNKQTLGERAEGEVSFQTKARQAKNAQPMFLDGKVFIEPPLAKNQADNYVVRRGKGAPVPKFSRRQALADYTLKADNAYFKRAVVNRVWKQLLGRGLVEPVDQIHEANPASHPKILDLLAEDFGTSGFDLRRVLANILHTDAYRRSSQWQQPDAADLPRDSAFAMARLRPLTPEQLLYSLATATQTSTIIETNLKKKRAYCYTHAGPRRLDKDLKPFIEMFHSEAQRFAAPTGQALFITYGKVPAKYFQNTPGNLTARLAKIGASEELVREAYLACLSRYPTTTESGEVSVWLEKQQGHAAAERCRDLVWALLNNAEFRFNH